MRSGSEKPTPCVISQSAISYARRSGQMECSGDAEECRVIEPVRKLMALGLTAKEIRELDIQQPALQAICEYARVENDTDAGARASDVLDASLKAIADQIHSLQLEIQMLTLRKSALRKRTRVLEKLAQALRSPDTGLLAA